MDKNELITKLVQNVNSAFTDSDADEFAAMSEDMLKRLYLSVINTPVQTVVKDAQKPIENANEKTEVQETVRKLKESLLTVQASIQNSLAAEQKIINELVTYGVTTAKSVINESMIDFDSFVQNSTSPVAQVMREALDVWNNSRQTLINTIVTNSLFSPEELEKETTEKLKKLASLANKQGVDNKQMSVRDNNPVFNWQGAGISNLPIVNDTFDTSPLLIPSTWE
jgi:hypothetical protein